MPVVSLCAGTDRRQCDLGLHYGFCSGIFSPEQLREIKMEKLKLVVMCTTWVALAVFLAPLWVPVAILASTGIIAKEFKGDSDGE
jgi:hypothetical protein